MLLLLPMHLDPIASGLIHNVKHWVGCLLLHGLPPLLLIGTRLLAALPRALLHYRVLRGAPYLIYT